MAASPTLPGVFMAMPPDETPAPTRPAAKVFEQDSCCDWPVAAVVVATTIQASA